jgi:hypothetical protein
MTEVQNIVKKITTSHSEPSDRTIQFSDRVACPQHGAVMVLVKHKLSDFGRKHSGLGVVTFFRCTAMVDHVDKNGLVTRRQCTFMRPNKYQKRQPCERHK